MEFRPFPLRLEIAHLPQSSERWGLPLDGSINSERYRYGQLAALARQVGAIQGVSVPQFFNPHLILLAADHGVVIAHDPNAVSISANEVKETSRSHQYVNALCRQNGFTMQLINVGLATPVSSMHRVVNCPVRLGSANLLQGDALSYDEMVLCLERGCQVVSDAVAHGANVIAIGLISRGARIPAAMWANQLAGVPLDSCVSDSNMFGWTAGACSVECLARRLREAGHPLTNLEPIYRYGGFDLITAVGAILQAASMHLTILIDSFPMLCALYVASQHYPSAVDYAIVTHMERTPGMEMLAQRLGIDPVLRLALYASEGIGSLSAYALIKGALPILGLDNDRTF